MKERTEQDREWLRQKQESGRINRLLLGGEGGCFHKGQFFRKSLALKTILDHVFRGKS